MDKELPLTPAWHVGALVEKYAKLVPPSGSHFGNSIWKISSAAKSIEIAVSILIVVIVLVVESEGARITLENVLAYIVATGL